MEGSPVQSPCLSLLYWGVEYRSRLTGPFSVVTKSKEVPFEVGTACRGAISLKENMSINEEHLYDDHTVVLMSVPQRQSSYI